MAHLRWSVLFLCASAVNALSERLQQESLNGTTYDYIIVGGGLSGLVVANRLSADPSVDVLVVEYGTIDDSLATSVPYLSNNINLPDMYNITSAPVADIANKTFSVLLGKVLGGGSVVNGMTYNRGSEADYDSWSELGNPGWDWEGLLPYFRKSTSFTPPPEEIVEKYGYIWNASAYGDGPLQANFPPYQFPDYTKYLAAFEELSISNQTEGSGAASGVFWVEASLDTRSMTRSTSKSAYYDGIANRPNLHLLTGQKVNKIVLSNLTASGIEFSSADGNSSSTAYASREVILAAGAVHTPQILQLSGIGPREVLENASVETILDLPGVGSGFQDHPVVYLLTNLTNASFPNPTSLTTNATFNQSSWQEYIHNKSGPYTFAHANTVAWLALDHITSSNTTAALLASLQNQNATSYLPPIYSDPTLLAGYLAQHRILTRQISAGSVSVFEMPFTGAGRGGHAVEKPLSRGTVHLNPSNPSSEPIVTYNSLSNPFDKSVLYEAIKWRRNSLFNTTALQSLGPIELVPGPAAQTEEEVLQALLNANALAPSFAHPSGSCAMMPRNLGGVVDSDLKVYGTTGLRIVDASIIPIIPAAHLQATVYAVAEKAADIIKGVSTA